MAAANKGSPYAGCPPRLKDPETKINADIAKEISKDYDVMPMFERGLYEYTYRKHYSMSTNDNIRCCWDIYKDNFATRVIAPIQFPNQRDIHFFKSMIRFAPSESVYKLPNIRKTLKHGPGVDNVGPLPTPQEAYTRVFYSSTKNSKGKAKERTAKKTPETEKPKQK